jgi:nucleoside-diphosphate-sugar epimerase
MSRGALPVAGDLGDPDALRRLVSGCSAVVHAAGVVRGASRRDFDRVNTDGTAALCDVVAQTAPSARLLVLSSLAAREPALSWYAASKRAAEERVAASGLDWTILRPPAVYGPGDQEMRAVFRTMARGLAPVPGSPAARVSLIHVEDLARAILACLCSPQTRHRTLCLDDGKRGGYDWEELASVAGDVYGRKVHLLRVPGLLLDGVAGLNLQLARLRGRAPMLTPAKLRELRHPDWTVDNAEISALTDWRPSIRLRAGLAALDTAGSTR